MNEQDQQFMQRALALAAMGKTTVSPNPVVGCVIVVGAQVIGEGWHRKAGEPHAEVLAINSVQNKNLLSEATVYVSLEPCAHFGRTPPCADLLVKHAVKRVVIGAVDPHKKVAGQGIAKLKAAGIAVQTGVLEQACLEINKAFFTYHRLNRPYIVLKWAQTADGYVARENFDSKWISHELSRQLVHKWRASLDAILVGKNTVLYDDPSLNTRYWPGKSPLRLVIDHQLALKGTYKIFHGPEQTIVFNCLKNEAQGAVELVKLPENDFLPAMLKVLHERQIQSVLVEGGSFTLNQFIAEHLWDEARVFQSPQQFVKGIEAPKLTNFKTVGHRELLSKSNDGDEQRNLLFFYENKQPQTLITKHIK